MKRSTLIYRMAAVLGIGLAIAPWAVQAQSDQMPETGAANAPAVTAIPVEDQATKEELGRLFEVMRLREQLKSVMEMVPAMMRQQMQAQSKQMLARHPNGGSITPDQQAEIDKLTGKFMDKAANVFTYDDLIEDMATVYQHHLSRSDVEAFIAFYGSTPGQHLLNEQPAIMREYLPIVMKQTEQRTKALTEEMSKEMKSITDPSAPSADKP